MKWRESSMVYEVYMQESRPFPKVGRWKFVCWTESKEMPADFNWNSIIIPLTGETVAEQSDKGIWWQCRAIW